MNFEKFINFIGSFHKNPGEFTKDEIYEIGKKHKSVEPSSSKSWAFVKDAVGWEGSAESLRSYINYRLKNDPQESCKEEKEEGSNPFTDELSRLYIEKTKFRDRRNCLNKSLRDEARIEDLKDIIREEIKNLNDLPVLKKDVVSKEDNSEFVEAILPVCDLHLGAEFYNSYNQYNLDIAVSRLTHLEIKTINYCKKHHVNKLNIINMGDMISGKIHVTNRIENMTDAISQTMKAAELLAQFIHRIEPHVETITYRSVSDNHSRITDDKSQHIEKENLNRIIDWFIEERLKATNIMFMKDNLDIGVGRFVLNNGKKVFFMHGHQDGKNSAVQNMFGLAREFPDYILMAHYHNSAEHTFQNAKLFVSGSIMGTDTYAYGKRLFGEPEQRLLIFEGNDLVTVEIKL